MSSPFVCPHCREAHDTTACPPPKINLGAYPGVVVTEEDARKAGRWAEDAVRRALGLPDRRDEF